MESVLTIRNFKISKFNNHIPNVFVSFLIYILFAISAITTNTIFNVFGCFILLLVILFMDLKKAFLVLVSLTPNNMIICFWDSSGFRIVGLFYLIVFLRIILSKKVLINECLLICYFIVMLICFFHANNGGLRDFLICSQTFLSIFVWLLILKNSNKAYNYKIYKSFTFGVFLMFLGMIMNKIVFNESRFVALSDDPNYTSVCFAVLLSLSLFFLINRIRPNYNGLVLLFSIIGGLLTGSRSFLLSAFFVILIYFIVGLKNKKVRLVFYFSLLLFILFLFLYWIKIPFIVYVYDTTIGRTLKLKESYSTGNFMDITSGRLFLWKYYLKMLFTSDYKYFFGYGFNYYLVENGGYGLVAHNTFVSGLMGIGIVGTFFVLLAYTRIIFLGNKKSKRWRNVLILSSSVLIAILVGYFFLDGLLDIRLPMYLSLYVIVKKVNFFNSGI